MSIRTRIDKLEQRAQQTLATGAPDVFADIAHTMRFLDGETDVLPPHPPCPAWRDLERWHERMQLSDCLLLRARGLLAADEYLDGMTEADKAYVGDVERIFQSHEFQENNDV